MTRHTRKWKEGELQELKAFVEKYPIIAIASLEGFPAALFAQIRKKLKGKAEIKVSKVRVVQKALKESKYKESKLVGYAEKSIALIGTSMNPFELYGFLKKNKGNVSAKPGQQSPEDITIPAMDTGLPPGPALTDLKNAGLKARMQGPTISITENKVVAKKGEQIAPAVAAVLQKLDIKPIRVGLALAAVQEKGEIFTPEVLDIDEEQVLQNIISAYQSALNLSVFAVIFNKESVPILVQKAQREARAVSIESEFIEPETAGDILAKAQKGASALKAMVKEAPAEPAKEEPKQETQKEPAEEKEQKAQKPKEAQEEQKKEKQKPEEPQAKEPEQEKEPENPKENEKAVEKKGGEKEGKAGEEKKSGNEEQKREEKKDGEKEGEKKE